MALIHWWGAVPNLRPPAACSAQDHSAQLPKHRCSRPTRAIFCQSWQLNWVDPIQTRVLLYCYRRAKSTVQTESISHTPRLGPPDSGNTILWDGSCMVFKSGWPQKGWCPPLAEPSLRHSSRSYLKPSLEGLNQGHTKSAVRQTSHQ